MSILSVGIAQKTFSLDTLLVETTRIPLKNNETGRCINILTKKDIEKLPATTFYELLQTISGVEIQSRGGFGVQGDIVMRGSTFSQVLVLIDGMRINDPLTGHFNCYIPISNMEIERIEILKGAGGAMYGPDAVGGVINIITKGFNSLENGTSFTGNFNVGEQNLVSSSLGVFHKKDNFFFGAGVSINQSTGEEIPAVDLDSINTLSGYNTYFYNHNFSVSAGYKINDNWQIKFRSSILNSDFNARYFYTSSPFDKSTEITNNWFNRLELKRQTISGAVLDINMSYKRSTDEFIFSPDFSSTNIHTMSFSNFTVNNSKIINSNFSYKYGVQGDFREIESNDRGDHSDYHFGGYFMSVYRPKNIVLTTIIREDYDQNYGFEFCPQVNFSYNVSNITLRGAAGRSIRAADYTERYVSNNLENLSPGRNLGNPDLLAERGWSEELGINYAPFKNTVIKATVFSRQSNNVIDYISTNQKDIGSVSSLGSLQDSANYFFAKNIQDVYVNGFELELKSKLALTKKSFLLLKGGYTYTQITDNNLGVYLSGFARELITGQIDFEFNSFNVLLTGLYKKRNSQEATTIASSLTNNYAVFNVNFGYTIKNSGINLNFQVLNLTDVVYQNILGAKMPGMWVMGGLKWNLFQYKG